MKKIWSKIGIILAIVLLISEASIIMSDIVEADESDFSFNGHSYRILPGDLYLTLIIDCDFPEGMPHAYYPYQWDTTLPEYYEMIWLTGEYVSGRGIISSNEFYASWGDLPGGEYKYEVIGNNSKVLFSHNFTTTHSYEATVKSANWIYKLGAGVQTVESSVNKNKINNIRGVELSINLENTGDIPITIGDPYVLYLNIEYQMNLYKDSDIEPIYSTEVLQMSRDPKLFEGQSTSDKYYLKPGEVIEYKENLKDNFIDLSSYGAGSYSVDGYIQFGNGQAGNFTINFNSDNVLTITEGEGSGSGTPGFDLIIVFCAIALFLFWKRK